MSPHFKQIREIIDRAKKARPSIVAIVGGGLVTATPVVVAKGIANLDIGIIGEGEHTVCEIADALENGELLQEIKGTIYRDGEGNYIIIKSYYK